MFVVSNRRRIVSFIMYLGLVLLGVGIGVAGSRVLTANTATTAGSQTESLGSISQGNGDSLSPSNPGMAATRDPVPAEAASPTPSTVNSPSTLALPSSDPQPNPQSQTANEIPAPTLPSPKTAPPHPESVPGYVKNKTVTATFRVYGDTGAVIAGFPVTMNRCRYSAVTLRFRTLGGASVHVGTAFYNYGAGSTDITPVITDSAGLVIIDNNCSQPVFKSVESNVLTDVIVEYVIWAAAP